MLIKQITQNKMQFFFRVRLGILSLLTLIFCVSLTSVAQGQIPFLFDLHQIPGANRIDHSPQKLGNLAVAPVHMDGYVLFNLASPIRYSEDLDPTQSIPPAQIRARQVERILQRVIKVADPETVEMKVGTLNNQNVIFLSDKNYPNFQQPIVTVTAYETQLYGSPAERLAEQGSQRIYSGLRQAWQERKPEYLWQQAIKAVTIFLGIIVASAVLVAIQISFNIRWRSLKKQQAESQELSKLEGTITSEDVYNEEYQQQILERQQKTIQFRRRRDWIFLWRRLVIIGLFIVWFWGSMSILKLFPHSRALGIWLEGKPTVLIGVWLFTAVLKKISDIVINRSLKAWAEDRTFQGKTTPRLQLRVATYTTALQGVTTIISIVLGLWLTLLVLEIPESTVLAGAGIVGLALSFGSQELIKNALSGFFILSIDPYAVGDVINIGNVGGFVEKVNLFYTQVRSADGELITIPHSTIQTIRNSTKEWSRLNLKVKVNYATDVDQAMEIIKEVALDLYFDSEWSDRIIEQPPELIGVEDLSHDGILIQTWIKTKPIEQWNVGREFRRRLKRRFDQVGILIGVPRLELQPNSNGKEISPKA
ncbi:hypothetical protein L8106_06754 [Lyngbya sp. PCC 8106]|nr:hypothetical protein L8106_06754 [Lyngbya sp. PCC 8106]